MAFLRRRQGGRRQDTDDRWSIRFSIPPEIFTGDWTAFTRFVDDDRTAVASLPSAFTPQEEDSPPTSPVEAPTPSTTPSTTPPSTPSIPAPARSTLQPFIATKDFKPSVTADAGSRAPEPTSSPRPNPSSQPSKSPTPPPSPISTSVFPSNTIIHDAAQLAPTSTSQPSEPSPLPEPSDPPSEPPLSSQSLARLPRPSTLVTTTTTPPTFGASLPSNSLINTAVSAIPTSVIGSNIVVEQPPTFGSAHSETSAPHPHRPNALAASLPPIIVVLLLGAFFALYLRRRRKQQRQPSTQLSEKLVPPNCRESAPEAGDSGTSTPIIGTAVAVPYYHPNAPRRFPPPALAVQSPSSASLVHPAQPPPVIIAPLRQDNAAYYTGIDTSDAVSMTPSGGAISAYNRYSSDGGHEEPPPPYRPRSVPSISVSRDSSLRLPEGLRTVLVAERERQGRGSGVEGGGGQQRNPFEDPEGDDGAVSDIEEGVADGGGGRDMEEMSEVSELSYQSDVEAVPRIAV